MGLPRLAFPSAGVLLLVVADSCGTLTVSSFLFFSSRVLFPVEILEKYYAPDAAATSSGPCEPPEEADKEGEKPKKAEQPGAAGAKKDWTAPEPLAEDQAQSNAALQTLRNLGVSHECYAHVTCHSADELVANVPLQDPTKETHTKNLFLKDKRHGLFLVSVRPDAAVPTNNKAAWVKQLGLTGKVNLRLADPKLLMENLQCEPGCVGPLAMALCPKQEQGEGDETPPKHTVTLVLDSRLLPGNENSFEVIHSHPLRNDASVKLSVTEFASFFEKSGIEPVALEFETAAPSSEQPNKDKKPQQQQPKKGDNNKAKKKGQDTNKKTTEKGKTKLALQWKKTENFANWYTDVITLSEMISYYDISGCYILRPWAYQMWELIQNYMNPKMQARGVENSYFPLFVSRDRLEKEKDHVEGFAAEVAWVTHSGQSELAKPIAIRPTSETIMYPAFSDWIQSHRDLPLLLNQWSNVVRWEFKYPTPFLRTREFLWQEGHTAHATPQEAQDMVYEMLDLYQSVYQDVLAVPVIKGYKTEKEKFAGGDQTTTVEAYIAGSGRAIQGATSHNLGQNFGKMFDITFQNEKGQTEVAWQTSWGLTTRVIGVMVMVHGDDVGLVLPPAIAPVQVVIVPIISKKLLPEVADPYCHSILKLLQAAGVRAKYDDRSAYNPGWKYNHWEQKGVPVRLEVGPRDMEQQSVRAVIRHDKSKQDLSIQEGFAATIQAMLTQIQDSMLAKATRDRDEHVKQVTDWKDFVPSLEQNNLVLTPWCGGEHQDWEEWVKTKSREESLASLANAEDAEAQNDERCEVSVAAKTLCIPFEQPELPDGTKCIASGLPATCWVLWGRSY